MPPSLASAGRPCGSDDPRDRSPSTLKEVFRCPGGTRCSVCGSRCHEAPGRRHGVTLPETVSARKGGPRFPYPGKVQDESWTRPATLSAASFLPRSSESSSQSILWLRGTRVSPRERSGSSATNDQETI